MKSDISISNEATRLPITEVAKKIGLNEDHLELYGKYKAKVDCIPNKSDKKAKLVLVTAVNPTPAGEGKTTTTIGLGQAFNKIGKSSIIALREPSLGPCMGVKGGATGGGYSQVIPMDEINLHFTGDFHAITTAHNLLSAMLDNHLHFGNELGIDTTQIVWKRVLDLNDRSLRNVVVGLGGKSNGVVREDGFMITVASEVMAILCLSKDIDDLKKRLGDIIVAYTHSGEPVTAASLDANNAMAALLKDAIKPNLVQTLEHTPVFIHGGPFANIAHGCNSIRATQMAMSLSDIVVTEAGFGADLGAEKFFDIKCRIAGLEPDAVVLVATVRALKYNGGVAKADLAEENVDALHAGICNLIKHIENIQKYNVPVVVTLNQFTSDTDNEIELIKNECEKLGADFALSQVWEKGGTGGIALAEKVLSAIENKNGSFKLLYPNEMPIKEKIETVAKEIYGADKVVFAPKALKELERINKMGFSHFPVCMAKTQYSFSDDPKKLGRPEGFSVTVSKLTVSAGAGFVVALLGDIMTMPGLSRKPAATGIDVDSNGIISGLF